MNRATGRNLFALGLTIGCCVGFAAGMILMAIAVYWKGAQ